MNKKILFLRISYWVCAIFELLAVIPMLSPKLFGLGLGIPNFNPGSDFIYAMGIGASFALGWVFLLIWADRKPMERKGVLLLTIIPVFVGNFISGVYAMSSGLVKAMMMFPSLTMQIIIIVLFGFSYYNAGKTDK